MADDSLGSDLPTMGADLDAAFAAEEAAANAARTAAKGAGVQRLVQEPEAPEPEPAPAKPATPAPAAAAPTPAPTPAAPAPAPAAEEDDPDALTTTDGRKVVPLGTLLKTRQGLKGQVADRDAAIAELKRQNEALLGIAQRVAPVAPAAPTPAPVVEPPPVNPFNKETHPLEHIEWKNEQLEKQVLAINKAAADEASQREENTRMAGARQAYSDIHQAFAAIPENKDYPDAYATLTNGWAAQYEAMGMSRRDAVAEAQKMEWSVVARAAGNNQHPSTVLFAMAKAAGWQPKAADATPAPGMPTPAQKIEIAAKGAEAAISLSDATGGTPAAAPSLTQIANMGKEEFHAKFSGADGDAEFRKLMMPTKGSARTA